MPTQKKTNDSDDPKLAKLVRVYIKMKAKRDEITAAYKAEEKQISSQMAMVKDALLTYCADSGLEGARTKDGLFYRTTTTNYWTNDWKAMHEFLVEHGALDMLEKRLHQGNTKQFLAEHPDVLPPGLNAETKYQISISKNTRRK